MADDLKGLKFGDLVENGYASEDSPRRVSIFVRRGNRSGRINSGPYIQVTDGKGNFWEFSTSGNHKLSRAGQWQRN